MPAALDPRTPDAHGVIDVATFGSALVDVLAPVDDDVVTELGLVKGTTALVDLPEAERLYAAAQPIVEVAGGSAANTAVGAASLGSRAAFVGKVADDHLGRLFDADIRAAGVDYTTAIAAEGATTGRCLSLVTPDAERTMCTYLGASSQLRIEDVEAADVGRARVTYIEGYLWDIPDAHHTIGRVMSLAHQSGGLVAINLSDPFCVERHGDVFRRLIGNEVDIVFANEAEITLLLGVQDVGAAAEAIRPLGILAALTSGEDGSLVLQGYETTSVDAHHVDKVVDVTGAGDLYAAGILHGLTHGMDLRACAMLASLTAGEIISHLGARPEVPLSSLAKESGLLL